jgi:hypothetical protein
LGKLLPKLKRLFFVNQINQRRIFEGLEVLARGLNQHEHINDFPLVYNLRGFIIKMIVAGQKEFLLG